MKLGCVDIGAALGNLEMRDKCSSNTRALPAWAADIDCSSWSGFLLKFVNSHPAVTVILPGTTKLDHMESNLRAGHCPMPDAAMRRRMADVRTT